MKELTENYIFKCECSTTTFSARDERTNSTSTNSNILTCKTMLNIKVSGPCPKQNGAPCSCAAVCGKWCNTSSKVFIKGNSALIDKSYILCLLGAKIKQVFTTIPTKFNEKKSINVFNRITESVPLIDNIVPVSSTNNPINEHAKIIGNNNNFDKEIQPANNVPTAESKLNDVYDDDFYCEYVLCDYQNCNERDECEYIKSLHTPLSINNDAAKLEKNFKNQYKEKYDAYIEKNQVNNEKSTEGNWSWAAHHIISGNQIFSKHPCLVNLANFYKYDINNADNCILLPTTHSFEGKQGIVKQANGYVAMDLMKQQWHVGGHEYTLESETVDEINKYLEKLSSSDIEFYRNYVEAVEHEINILESKYKKKSCRKKNYDEKQKRFIENMNRVSNKVMNKLLDFENGYKKSYPFYVSKEAYKFAFDVPKRKKFIVIYKINRLSKTIICAEKFNMTRYSKDDYKVVFSSVGEAEIIDSKSFIIFSENVKYFINFTKGEYLIPWIIDKNREYVIDDTMTQKFVSDYCAENEQKIVAFVEGRENGEMYYDSSTKIIRERMKSIREI